MAGVWSAGNAAGKYADQPLKASYASYAEGLAPLLCALSPTSRPYLSLGLSIRATLFVDRCHNLVLASTEIPIFMDKIAKLTVVSIKTTLFMDSPRFRWRGMVSRQRGWQICRPAAQSKLRELRRRARSAALCPEPNLPTLSALSPSNKPQSRHADSHARREDRPQSRKARQSR